MIERAVIVVAVVALVVIVSLAVRAVGNRRTAEAGTRPLPDALRSRLRGAGIVYFYGPHCPTCRQQRDVLDSLTVEAGVSVLAIDAVDEPSLARALNVMTVPTTVVVDAATRIREINVGFRPLVTLRKQIAQ
jgi:thiol-disulfide isomerase/thioredoxin